MIDLFLPPESDYEHEPYLVELKCVHCKGNGIKYIDPKNAAPGVRDRVSRIMLEVAAELINDKHDICDACDGHGHVLLVFQGFCCHRWGNIIMQKACIENDPTALGCCQPLWTLEKELFSSKLEYERGFA